MNGIIQNLNLFHFQQLTVKSCIFIIIFTVNIGGGEMINQTTKDKIQVLHQQYLSLVKGNESFLKEITLAEIPERQTIPAFRMREKWMISADFLPTR